MIHKKIHTQAKRAHAHIQNHGHKRLWLLSGVFIVILAYPYFSNAQSTTISATTPDLCLNIEEVQASLPANHEIDTNGDCVCADGFERDSENNCVEEQENEENTEEICENGAINFDACDLCEDGFDLDEENNCIEIQAVLDEEVIALTGTITYDPSTSTTETVTATLTGFSTTGVTITNNNGNNTYIFTEDGSFTFEFTNENNATGSATATVNWIIDAVLPPQNCEISITSPLSEDILGGSFPIQRESNTYCNDENITIQLRDHNNQRISIGTGLLYDEEFIFASTGLASTGFYTLTGLHLSGAVRETVNENGVVIDSGVYTQDTEYIIYTGAYNGNYSDFATGYQIRIIDTNEQVLAESDDIFTIDNQIPILSDLLVTFAPVVGGKIGKPGIMTASFTVSEQLTGTTTFSILGTNITPSSGSQSGDIYTYTIPLTSIVASGALAFTAHVTDLAGNTGVLYGTSDIILDNHIPQISGFAMSGSVPSLQLSRKTDVQTMYSITINTGTANTGANYGTAHTYTIQNTQYSGSYAFTLVMTDLLGNAKTLSGNIEISATGGLSIQLHQAEDDILQLSEEVETSLYLQILQNEINKFQACKSDITFSSQTIPVGNKNIVLKIPSINEPSVNQKMGIFIIFFINKIQGKTTLSQAQLDITTEAVNNFLVVIKLVDDDDNSCEQKMGSYYMGAFKSIMTQMNFF